MKNVVVEYSLYFCTVFRLLFNLVFCAYYSLSWIPESSLYENVMEQYVYRWRFSYCQSKSIKALWKLWYYVKID